MNDAGVLTEVRVPDMGNFKDVEVIDVLVKPGESVAVDTPLVTLESEKASMDVPSTAAGVIEKVTAAKGGKVNTGDVIATVRAQGAATSAAPAEAASAPPPAPRPSAAEAPAAAAPAASVPAAPAAAPETPAPQALRVPRSKLGMPTSYRSDLAPIDEPGFSRAHASPSVRRFARELGVDLAQVAGHGFKERITHEDVKGYVEETEFEGRKVSLPQDYNQLLGILRDIYNEKVNRLMESGFVPRTKLSKKILLQARVTMSARLKSGGNKGYIYAALVAQAQAIIVLHALELAETQGVDVLLTPNGGLITRPE